MEGIDVVRNCLAVMKKHPIIFVPQLVSFLLSLGLVLLLFATVYPAGSAFSTNPNPSTASAMPSFNYAALAQLLPVLVILGVVIMLVEIVLQAMTIYLTLNWKKDRLSLKDAFDTALNRFFKLLLYWIIILIIWAIIIIALFLPVISSAANLMSSPSTITPSTLVPVVVSILLSALLGIVIVLILMPFIFVGGPIIILENVGPVQAFMSSIDAGKKDFFGIIGVLLVFGIVYFVLYIIVSALSIALGVIPLVGGVVSAIGSIFLGTFLTELSPMYYTTFVKPPQAIAQPAANASTKTKRRRK